MNKKFPVIKFRVVTRDFCTYPQDSGKWTFSEFLALPYLSTFLNIRVHYFCTIFWAFHDKPFFLWYSLQRWFSLRKNQIEILRANSNRLIPSLEQIERQLQALEDDSNTDKELRHLARLLYVGQLVEHVGLLYSLNEQTFCQFLSDNKHVLQKPLS